MFARGFFVGPADWVVAVGGGLLLALFLFGHFSWLLWLIGFVGRRSRPVEFGPFGNAGQYVDGVRPVSPKH